MKQYRVYHPLGHQMRLAAVVTAKSKQEAIGAAAARRGLTGHHAYVFGLVAKARLAAPLADAGAGEGAAK